MLFPKSLPLIALMVLVLVTAEGCVPVSTSSSSQPATGAPVAPVVQTETATDLSTPAAAGLRPLTVANVTVDVGVGSPIPVDAFVSGEWPDLCAQLAQITQRYEGKTFDITLLATAADPACPPDFLGLPFRIAIPINVVELPEGQYTVTANGATTTFSVPVTSPASQPPAEDPAMPPAGEATVDAAPAATSPAATSPVASTAAGCRALSRSQSLPCHARLRRSLRCGRVGIRGGRRLGPAEPTEA